MCGGTKGLSLDLLMMPPANTLAPGSAGAPRSTSPGQQQGADGGAAGHADRPMGAYVTPPLPAASRCRAPVLPGSHSAGGWALTASPLGQQETASDMQTQAGTDPSPVLSACCSPLAAISDSATRTQPCSTEVAARQAPAARSPGTPCPLVCATSAQRAPASASRCSVTDSPPDSPSVFASPAWSAAVSTADSTPVGAAWPLS